MKVILPSEAESGVFRQEINTLRRNLGEVLKHSGEWVLIKGDNIVDYYKSFSEAITEGYDRFGREVFMTHEVGELTHTLVEATAH
ncbi:MAG: hypothetical protein CEO19_93 [Parcubacteria group bacterium Gr01-1014_73]|nr:MAG: hypothetical protein CEO19_93 [Parcubacteria group bacterium Gr01-1014_73]